MTDEEPTEYASPGAAGFDVAPDPSVTRDGLSLQQLTNLGGNEEVRVATRPDGSKGIVKLDGVEDLVHTKRETLPDGTPISLRFVIGYDVEAAGITLSPSMIENLIELLETEMAAFEEAGQYE